MATRSVPADRWGGGDREERIEAIFRKYQAPPDPRETAAEEAVIRAMGRDLLRRLKVRSRSN